MVCAPQGPALRPGVSLWLRNPYSHPAIWAGAD